MRFCRWHNSNSRRLRRWLRFCRRRSCNKRWPGRRSNFCLRRSWRSYCLTRSGQQGRCSCCRRWTKLYRWRSCCNCCRRWMRLYQRHSCSNYQYRMRFYLRCSRSKNHCHSYCRRRWIPGRRNNWEIGSSRHDNHKQCRRYNRCHQTASPNRWKDQKLKCKHPHRYSTNQHNNSGQSR